MIHPARGVRAVPESVHVPHHWVRQLEGVHLRVQVLALRDHHQPAIHSGQLAWLGLEVIPPFCFAKIFFSIIYQLSPISQSQYLIP